MKKLKPLLFAFMCVACAATILDLIGSSLLWDILPYWVWGIGIAWFWIVWIGGALSASLQKPHPPVRRDP